MKIFFQPKPEGDGRPVILRSNGESIDCDFRLGLSENQLDKNLFLSCTDFATMLFQMKDGRPVIVLWCALVLLLAVVVVVRMIHKRGEPPLSSMKVISDTNGLVTAITVSNQSVATFTYGYDTNRQKMADTNIMTHHYGANGEEITDLNASSPSGK